MANRGSWRKVCPRWIKQQVALTQAYSGLTAHEAGAMRRSLIAAHRIYVDHHTRTKRTEDSGSTSTDIEVKTS